MMVAWVGFMNMEPNTTKYNKSKSRSPLNITQPCVLFSCDFEFTYKV